MPENGEVSSVQLRPKGQNTVSVFNSVVHFLEPFAMKNCRVDDSFDKKKVLISFLTTQSMEKTIKNSWNEIVAYQSKMLKQTNSNAA